MRYLGIDYGTKRVGLALSDDDGKMAFPYKIIQNNLELVDTIHNICGQEEISAIVLGESTDLSGKPNKIMGSIEEFKRNLEGELDLPIYFEKEFMTTIEARRQPSQSGGQAQGRAGKPASNASSVARTGWEANNAKKVAKTKQAAADASAAALILGRYLDRKNNQ